MKYKGNDVVPLLYYHSVLLIGLLRNRYFCEFLYLVQHVYFVFVLSYML